RGVGRLYTAMKRLIFMHHRNPRKSAPGTLWHGPCISIAVHRLHGGGQVAFWSRRPSPKQEKRLPPGSRFFFARTRCLLFSPLRDVRTFRKEFQCGRVQAVAQAGGRRPVREDMAEMAVAAHAAYLGARHPPAAVGDFADMVRVERPGEARPAGAALEFPVSTEE